MQHLSSEDLQNTKNRYKSRFRNYGHDQKSVGWGHKGRQEERFKILTDLLQINNLDHSSILDIGAGFGDLFPFLQTHGFNIKNYTGYELVEDLVLQGINAYGSDPKFNLVNEEFLLADHSTSIAHDYAFMSGCFNFKLINGDNYDYISQCLTKAFAMTSKGIAANFITDKVDYSEDYIFYADPARILNIAYGISRRFVLDHSYVPFEFSISIFRDQSFDPKYPIFNDSRIV